MVEIHGTSISFSVREPSMENDFQTTESTLVDYELLLTAKNKLVESTQAMPALLPTYSEPSGMAVAKHIQNLGHLIMATLM